MTTTRAVFMTGVRQVEVQPLALAPLASRQVRTRTLFSGISSGTEMAYYRGTAPHFTSGWDGETRLFRPDLPPDFAYPAPYGYSNVGRVIECGDEVRALKPGDVVFSYFPHQAEAVADEDSFIPLPEGLDPMLGVLLVNTRTTYNAILDAAIRLGETVVIFGQGVLGQLLAQLARRSGAGQVVVVDPIPGRRELSLKLGADAALDPREGDVALAVRQMTARRGADVVIEVSGTHAGLREAIRTVAPRGTVVGMGFYQGEGALNLGAEYHHNWVDLRCSQAGSIHPSLSHRWTPRRLTLAAAGLLPKLALAPLVTHVFEFERAPEAYALVDRHAEETMQVVLRYD